MSVVVFDHKCPEDHHPQAQTAAALRKIHRWLLFSHTYYYVVFNDTHNVRAPRVCLHICVCGVQVFVGA